MSVSVLAVTSLSSTGTAGTYAPLESIQDSGIDSNQPLVDGLGAPITDSAYFDNKHYSVIETTLSDASPDAISVRIQKLNLGSHVQAWAFSPAINRWYDVNVLGFGDPAGIPLSAALSISPVKLYVISDQVGTFPVTINLVDTKGTADLSDDTSVAISSVSATIARNYSLNLTGTTGNRGVLELKASSDATHYLVDAFDAPIANSGYFDNKGYVSIDDVLLHSNPPIDYTGNVRVSAPGVSASHVQMWVYDAPDHLWFDINDVGFGPGSGVPIAAFIGTHAPIYVVSDVDGSYPITFNLVDATTSFVVAQGQVTAVVDTTAPVIVAHATVTVEATSASGATVTYTSPVTSDNIDSAGVATCLPASGTTFALGTTPVSCNATDAAGNQAVTTNFNVVVQDTTAPVITLNGSDPDTVSQGSGTYSDPGAIASDAVTSSITVQVSGTVNTNVLGDYVLTYDASDGANNAATPVARTVHVVDTTPPVISAVSLSPSTGYAKIGTVVTLHISADAAGYTAGTITVNGVAVTGFTDNGAGSYSATYTVVAGNTDRASGATPVSVVLKDAANNSNTAFTSVTANTLKIDAHAPTLVSAQTTSGSTIDLTFSEDLDGVTVTNTDFSVAGSTLTTPDAYEVSGGVVRLTTSASFGTDATPLVSYSGVVHDLAGNSAATSSVTPTDGAVPVISETTAISAVTKDTTPDYVFTSGEVGTVTYGGDCSSAITSATVGLNTVTFNALIEGTHSNCTVRVTDVSGNPSALLAVSSFRVDTTAPVISSHTAVTAEATSSSGAAVTYTVPTTSDVGDGSGVATCLPASGSTFALGTTDVSCDATDLAGNTAIQTHFNIVVEDTTAPVITLVGDNPQTLVSRDTYPELGATAVDNFDTNSTANIVINSSAVDTFTVGSYTVTYSLTDAHGNVAAPVTRTVNVVARPAPVSGGGGGGGGSFTPVGNSTPFPTSIPTPTPTPVAVPTPTPSPTLPAARLNPAPRTSAAPNPTVARPSTGPRLPLEANINSLIKNSPKVSPAASIKPSVKPIITPKPQPSAFKSFFKKLFGRK